MKIVISIDSFKGSVSSLQAANAVETGIMQVYPEAKIIKLPLADGGEGTVDALCDNKISVKVTGPLGETVSAEYGMTDNNTAVIEMSAAAGLTLVPTELRNPMYTTTYGVGELIIDAIKRGCRNFIIGIGGSATNDGGVGMLSALGYKFLNLNGKPVSFGAIGLKDLAYIDDTGVCKELSECKFNVACDVSNPLCGDNGCSKIYGPQKGAGLEDIFLMDKWLDNYAKLTKNKYPNSDAEFPGVGAAGGMGFAFLSYLNSELKSGVETIIKHTRLEEKIKDADFVITGEGRLDAQSAMGKAPVGVAALAKRYGVPVIAFCGCVGEGSQQCNEHGIDAYFPVLRKVTSLDEALDVDNTISNIQDASKQVFSLIKTVKNV